MDLRMVPLVLTFQILNQLDGRGRLAEEVSPGLAGLGVVVVIIGALGEGAVELALHGVCATRVDDPEKCFPSPPTPIN
jgi:hypothetical protein